MYKILFDILSDQSNIVLTEEDLVCLPGVKRAILEAIRLRSPGIIIRGVTKTFKVKVSLKCY